MTAWLPPLVLLSGKEWEVYIEELYAIFHEDFCEVLPNFTPKPLRLKRHPVIQGKAATFWHFISEGDIEAERTPDLRRCERISWPKPIIEACGKPEHVAMWRNKRGNGEAYILAPLDFSYKVVVVDRGDYALPWTTIYLERQHQRDKMRKEFIEYWKKLGPPPTGGSGPVTPSTLGR